MKSVREPSHGKRRHGSLVVVLASAVLAGSFTLTPGLFAADTGEPSHEGHATPVAMPGWTQQLKGQTVVENAIEGRAGNAEKMEMQHHRLMQKLEQQAQEDAKAQQTSGAFNNMSMMHQYMGQDGSSFLLMTDSGKGEPVSALGGKCPSNVPVRKYDVSMINIEITLNRWLDYYPGYMYVLTEDVDKVRAEETRNKDARDKEGFDPGSVTTGLQGDMIQPLVLRANQGDCVKMTLRNQMESEDGSLFIQASSMIVSTTGKPATTTNPESIISPGKQQEFEWYIHPQMQEGVRQFHSYSHDRELTVLGLFGAFVVEPKGSKYLDAIGTGPDKQVKTGWQVKAPEVCCALVSPDLLHVLREAEWPGNVRELQHCIERAVVTTKSHELNCADVVGTRGLIMAPADLRSVSKGAKKQAEKARIIQALQDSQGNRAQAAKNLRISRASLYNKLREYDLASSAQPR